jgi:hypothetical protein
MDDAAKRKRARPSTCVGVALPGALASAWLGVVGIRFHRRRARAYAPDFAPFLVFFALLFLIAVPAFFFELQLGFAPCFILFFQRAGRDAPWFG